MRPGASTPVLRPDLLELSKMDAESVMMRLESQPQGLDDSTASTRLAAFGPNVIAHEKAPGRLRLALVRVINPLVILLLVLAGISFFIGDVRAALFMLAMVTISIGLGTIQESRSSRAASQLEARVRTSATVFRRFSPQDSKAIPREIPQQELVPGDLIALSAGDLIPADARLLSAKDFSVSQAILTGESLPVDKRADRSAEGAQTPFEAPNLCFLGSNVMSGTATAIVIATGRTTYLGSLAKTLVGQRAQTHFDQGITRFTWLMIWLILFMAPAVFLINGLIKGAWLEALLFALSVAVGLTPEMLPMIVTVNLAKGALDMSRKQVIVKRLGSIQNFGGMDVLCADKTGTLTRNQVILQRHLDVFGRETQDVLQYAYLNSLYQTGLKNLLDAAILRYCEQDRVREIGNRYEKVDEIPFDFSRKRMSVVVREVESGRHLLICKGAVEEVYQACSRGTAGQVLFPLDESHREILSRLSLELNQEGFRVIALAIQEFPPSRREYSVADERDLTLVGYLAFLDPPKEGASEALQALATSGVRVKILTGDNEVISRKICEEVGLGVERALLGAEVEKMTDLELASASDQAQLFAKLTPDQKARIIRCLQSRDHVVGFLGDGINDGPALRTADVGISVDSAVDIAKESADIILLQKSLLVLHEGVIEGRKVFANIIKYIRMNASSNFGNVLSVLGASAFLPFLPMQPIQVLTNNLLYDISQTTIPTDHVDPELLLKPRKWDLKGIRRFILMIGPISSIFDYVTFFILLHVFGAWQNPTLFQTGWFVESLVTQTLIIHVIRTNRIPFLQSRPSAPLLLTSALTIFAALKLPSSALAPALKLTRLPRLYWLFLALTSCGYLLLTQFVKVRWAARLEGESPS